MMRARRALVALLVLPAAAAAARADPTDDYIRAEMQKRRIPGLTLCVAKDGRLLKEKAYGVASLELSVPAGAHTVYPLASMTEVFTASAVMLLAQEGKLAPEDRIGAFLPDLPEAWGEVTIRQLLTHTSGLPDVSLDPEAGELVADTRDEALRKAAEMPLPGRPGGAWRATQTNYLLLAMAVEKLSGAGLKELVARRFFQPLRLGATRYADPRDIVQGRSSLYAFRADGTLETAESSSPPALRCCAGLNTTAAELVKWVEAIATRRFLKESRLEEMWTPVKLGDGSTVRFPELDEKLSGRVGFGAGWEIVERPGHTSVGASGGGSTAFARFLEDKLTVAVLTNCTAADPDSLVHGVAALYIPGLTQAPSRAPTPAPAQAPAPAQTAPSSAPGP